MRRPSIVALVLLSCAAAGASAQGGIATRARGFADFNYIVEDPSGRTGFRNGQIVGHLTSGLTDRLALFSEASATPASDGFRFEIERLILRYDQSDRFKVGLGRFHAPITYWNIAYHHGKWLQPSLSRPDMVEPTTGFIPMHFLGLWAEGSLLHSPVGIDYVAGVGNGRHSSLTRAGDGGDVNSSRAFIASATVSPPVPSGVRFGAAFYADRVTPSDSIDVSERMLTAHVAVARERPEIVLEYARITHQPEPTGDTFTSEAAYALVGYRLPGAVSAFKPYLRLDRTSVPGADPVFGPLGLDHSGRVVGLRYDVAPTAALKAEYRSERSERGPRQDAFALQLSFTFPGIASDPDPMTDHTGSHRDSGASARR